MSRLLCCLRARRPDMGAALSHPQEGEVVDGAIVPVTPPTMADVIRERKKKAGSTGLSTLRRRLAAAARRPRDNRPDRGCEHARFVRSVVSSWRLGDVFLVCGELEAASALRDLVTQAELAREPAGALHMDLHHLLCDRWRCDVELVGSGWTLAAHRAILAARSTYFRELLQRYPPSWARVPLEGAAGGLAREQLEACLRLLYAGTQHRPLCAVCTKYERGGGAPEGSLDIISSDNTAAWGGGGGGGGGVGGAGWCSCGAGAAPVRRLAALLGFQPDELHQDLRYLLDSGEMCDARLVFRLEGGGAAYGFRSALDLPCHRVVLAARSRFFRNVLSRRASGGAVCVDEKVLPRRFARALLHAAYTDQVDLSLIGRNSSSPSSTTSSTSGGSAWPGVARSSSSRPTTTAMLDDAFQLYEIARFLEMPIVMQGCEDAIVFALSADTLAHVLRWSAAPHASHWVHRQAMRYLRDEFPSIMSHAGAAKLSRATLAAVLASPFTQAGEGQLARALLRWADRAQPPEPNLVWHTGGGRRSRGGRGGRGAAGRGAAPDPALRDLLPLVRLEHLPPDHDVLHHLVRRGLVEAGSLPAAGGSADAWLGRGAHRPARCFLPYLDEIKALLEGQTVPEAELARARRQLCMQRIPDTLYMVAAARGAEGGGAGVGGVGGGGADAACGACVSPRLRAALVTRVRELTAAPPAATALAAHCTDPTTVYRQIALRAVREMSLPDSCAELLLADIENDRERVEEWSSPGPERRSLGAPGGWTPDPAPDCCRTVSGSGSLRCASTGSLRSVPTLHLPLDGSRAGTCRRDATCSADTVPNSCGSMGRGGARRARLSSVVPDVAMAPNANTHLLTARDYCRHPPHPHRAPPEYSAVGVMQLDLGDGATHTPRPGSRAQRSGAPRPQRDHSQAMSCLRARPEDDELRAAIELSVIRAYSSMAARAAGVSRAAGPPAAATLPHHRPAPPAAAPPRSPAPPPRRPPLSTPPPLLTLGPPPAGCSRSPSPPRARTRHDYTLYTHRDYRSEGSHGSGSGASRGHSPNHYA